MTIDIDAIRARAAATQSSWDSRRTETGRILLDVFLAPRDTPDAIRMNEEAIVRHAIPRIEAEAVRSALDKLRAEVEGLRPPGSSRAHVSRPAVIQCIDNAMRAIEEEPK